MKERILRKYINPSHSLDFLSEERRRNILPNGKGDPVVVEGVLKTHSIIPYNSHLKERAKELRKNSTLSEKILWNALKNKKFLGLRFQRQRMIANFILDFYCKELKLGIEIDGITHDFKYEYDRDREEKLKKLNVKILRILDDDVKKNVDSVLIMLKEFILRKFKNPPRPLDTPPREGRGDILAKGKRDHEMVEEVLKNCKNYIFDLDGTLVDLENLNINAYSKTLSDNLNLKLTQTEYNEYFAGTRNHEAFEKYLIFKNQTSNIEELIKNFREIKEDLLINDIFNNSKEIKGAIEFLNLLKQKSYKLCLATSTIKKFTEIILKSYKIYDLFDFIITAEDVKNGKPNPEIYNLVLSKLNSRLANSLVFEDSVSGITSAQNAEIRVIGILNKGKNDREVQSADFIVENYLDLIKIIK